jgi:LAO/AO transport system kinase
VTAATIAAGVRAGDRRALARAISIVEREGPAAAAVIGALHAHTGGASTVGVTGPPGAGKSTLVDALVHEWRRRGRRVGVIAVDPTSPFTGGALLGDRIRMAGHAADPDVFIRSMATRGALGGLARATGDAATVLAAAGFDLVLVETVGVGQDEVDVVRTADVSVVVLVPGLGDEVQALKAGLMEIADVFVVNKADREGADRAAAAIEALLAIGDDARADGWTPPVLRTRAADGQGVSALADAVDAFLATQRPRLDTRRRLRAEARVSDLLGRGLLAWLTRDVLQSGEFAHAVDRVAARELDPHAAAAALLERAKAGLRATGH